MSKTPFFSINYTETPSGRHPIVTVKLNSTGKEIHLPAYVDTGCTNCDLSLTTDIVKKYKLKLKKRQNTHTEPAELADGSLVASDEYLVDGEVAGEKTQLWVSVINPYKKLPRPKKQKKDELLGLLGRDFLDLYDAVFEGKNAVFSLLR